MNTITEKITGARIIWADNSSHAIRRNVGSTFKIESLVDLAIALDIAAAENISRRGSSGDGAYANLEIIFDGDDPRDDDNAGERISYIDGQSFNLPIGDRKKLRKELNTQLKSTVWDGHNHVQCPAGNMEIVMEMFQSQK